VARSADLLAPAIAALRADGLVVYPTETFYGVGARALSRTAVRAVATLKDRIDAEPHARAASGGSAASGETPPKPIALILADRTMLDRVVTAVPRVAERLIARFWPGPLTLVLPARDDLPPELAAGTGRVGVRVSSHPLARELSAAVGEPITATSANRASAPPATDVATARAALGSAITAYVDGGVVAGGLGSTVLVVDDDAARIVRAGAIPADALRDALGAFPLLIPS